MARRKINVGQQKFGFADEDLKTPLHDEIVLWLKKNAAQVSRRLLEYPETWDPTHVENMRSKCAEEIERRKTQLQNDLKTGVLWRHSSDEDKSRLESSCRPERIRLMQEHLRFLESWQGLKDPPPPRIEVATALERPITRERYKAAVDIVGYVDILFSISTTHLCTPWLPNDQSGKPMLGSERLAWLSLPGETHKVALDAKSTIPSLGQLIRDLNTYRTWRDWPFVVVSPDARFAEAIADEGFGFIEYPDGVFLQPRAFRQTPPRGAQP